MVEAHIREIFAGAANDGLEYKIYTQTLSGGYDVAKVHTEYLSELSFEQKIVVDRVFDPTLTGFDPLARASHKGDGDYCFELIPKTREDLVADFGEEVVKTCPSLGRLMALVGHIKTVSKDCISMRLLQKS